LEGVSDTELKESEKRSGEGDSKGKNGRDACVIMPREMPYHAFRKGKKEHMRCEQKIGGLPRSVRAREKVFKKVGFFG